MAIIVPISDLPDGVVDAYREQVVTNLRNLASQKLTTGADNITVRDLDLEEDVSATNEDWKWTLSTANDYNTILSSGFTVPIDRFFSFFGVHLLTAGSAMQKIKYAQGGVTTDIWAVRHLLAKEEPSGISRRPIMATSSTPLQISLYGNTAQDEEVVFMAYAAEKKGRFIAEKSFGG